MAQKVIMGGLVVLAAAAGAGCQTADQVEEKIFTSSKFKAGPLEKGNFEDLVKFEHRAITGTWPAKGTSIADSLEIMRRATAVTVTAAPGVPETAEKVMQQAKRYDRMVGLAEALQGAVTVTAKVHPAFLDNLQHLSGWAQNTTPGTPTYDSVKYFSKLATNLGNIASMTIQVPTPEQNAYQFVFTMKAEDKVSETTVTSKPDKTNRLILDKANTVIKDAKDAKPLQLEIKNELGKIITVALDPASRTLYTTQSNATVTAVRELLNRLDISENVVTGTALKVYSGSPIDITKTLYYKDKQVTPTAVVVIGGDRVYATNVTQTAFQNVARALLQKHIAIEQHDVEALTKLTAMKDHKGKVYATMDDVYEARKQFALKQDDFGEMLALMDERYSTKTAVMTEKELDSAIRAYAQTKEGKKFEIKAALTYNLQVGRGTQLRLYGVVDPESGGREFDAKMSILACLGMTNATTTAQVLDERGAGPRYLRPSQLGNVEYVQGQLNTWGEPVSFAAFAQKVADGNVSRMNGERLWEPYQAGMSPIEDGKASMVLSPAIIDSFEKKQVYVQAFKAKDPSEQAKPQDKPYSILSIFKVKVKNK